MNYQETLSYLYSCLPSIDKKGWGAYKPGLSRVREMLRLLDDPQESYPVIHVAGTNGNAIKREESDSIIKLKTALLL